MAVSPIRALLAVIMIAGAFTCSLPENGESGDASTDTSIEGSIGDVATETSPVDGGAPDTSNDVAADVGPLAPNELGTGLEFWVRSDDVVTDDAGTSVLGWHDRSGHNDVSRNALPTDTFLPMLVSDAGYGWPVVNFAGNAWLQTGQWSGGPFAQPITILIVGDGVHYFLDSLDDTAQFAVVGITNDLRMYAGSYVYDGGNPVGKRVIVATFDTLNSVLRNNQNSPTTVGNPGANAFKGITLGQYAGRGAGYSLNGDLAEVAIWSRVLAGSEIAALNAYAGARYNIAINP